VIVAYKTQVERDFFFFFLLVQYQFYCLTLWLELDFAKSKHEYIQIFQVLFK